ncbi:hypothetical protein [Paramaledivibacter caminithermalis]|jgi:vacuolar-type H+-ATPase subunit I/STV1|uniref:Uncharacterized protein n=1 Tax=Paramaledivibacter caminithermalis (strain DSM 15212 / CIP 107654 / DViRD3) TaxID=1121301 RepID=A0A1M6MCV6_PARC5|nr:hypothetical protein [Paramaledivibacter caminithermalis]SHJ81265.1 hypothetical protein SAMN02745912_01168 [Paramaledivibacter caminithermalis DSM 15212]
MNLSKKTTLFIVLIAILWVTITIMGWTGNWFPAMFLGLVLMILHMMLGSAQNGKLNKRLFFYPLLCWLILWTMSFALSYHYGNLFAGKLPNFTILGFHPSFAWTILTYWIGGVATLSLGFVVQKDLWLSDKNWEEFKRKIAKMNEEKGGEYSDGRS